MSNRPKSKRQWRRCLFCGKRFAKRPNGDHVIPAGFGRFTPLLLLNTVCTKCDNDHGNTWERAILRKGVSGWFRLRYGIKSNNNKGQPLFNPIKDPKNSGKRTYFDLKMETDGIVAKPCFDNDNRMHKPYFVGFFMKDGTEIKEDLDSSMSLPEMRQHILDKCKTYQTKKFHISATKEIVEDLLRVMKELGEEGSEITLLDKYDDKEVQKITSRVKVTFDRPYARGCALMLFKSMICLGFDPKLIAHLRRFITYGKIHRDEIAMIDNKNTGLIFDESTPIADFCHRIQWHITKTHLHGYVGLFGLKSGEKKGAVSYFRFKLSPSRKIIPASKGAVRVECISNKDGVISAYLGEEPFKFPDPQA
jgi:hypothetical protein